MPSPTRTYHLNIAAGLILLSAAAAAQGQDQNPPPSLMSILPVSEQALYKGFVGNLLEEMPIEPEQRVQLQRGNAVVGNAMSGRSLATFLGMASPPLMIVGLIWGIWAAMNIGTDPESIAKRKGGQASTLAGKDDLPKSAAGNASGERSDSLCSNSVAAECERLEDLFQFLPAKKIRGRPADQGRREAAHAQIDSGMTDLREMPLLEVVLEQPSIR